MFVIFHHFHCDDFFLHYYCRHYSIVAPDVIRPNSEYYVAISLHDSLTPCEIRVGIEGIQNGYSNYRDTSLQPYTSQLLRFNTGFMQPGQYRLNAEGLSGIDFRNERPINLVSKNASVFVQSDKAIYKPGDLVRFRILVLDYNLKPVTSQQPINIFITVKYGSHFCIDMYIKGTRINFFYESNAIFFSRMAVIIV